MDVGSVADWVNAAGTLLAFGGAIFAGTIALRSYKIQQSAMAAQLASYNVKEQRRSLDDRQAQARKVAAWIIRQRDSWSISGVNASGLPVYDVVLYIGCEDPKFAVAIERGTQGPSAPTRSIQLSGALQHTLQRHNATDVEPTKLQFEIAFTDMSSVRWLRNNLGLLTEVPNEFNFDQAEERFVVWRVPILELPNPHRTTQRSPGTAAQ